MNILLMTTCICNEENTSDLKRLISSLNKVNDINIKHLVLLQDYQDDKKFEADITNENYDLRFLEIEGIISLSKARNMLITEANDKRLFECSDFVSFPDDDCWYPEGFWNNFKKIEREQKFGLFYTDFSSKPVAIDRPVNQHNTANLVRYASSNTSFYRADVFIKIGLFDENFGVGAKNNGGEDLDYVIRAMLLTEDIYFLNSPVIGHRDPLPQFRYKYYRGSFGVLSKHKAKTFTLFYQYLRKFLIGLVFLSSKKIRFSEFKTIR
ncbi:glycosyltransferase family 2 protein [Vibrio europaeus]|uniref:Glycosyltransferase family 2 protein n=1 Tax=Vibrio europaeus TaxID=300876 RepID=A0A178J8U9_9VIBR|nr:glycosyltransferase family A protein [Vibrio europaeus]MDC5705013.1 glycosyltransferase family A protein [Vibrio europaeus]MDC5710292.1 glycosyltransferase family 2 protein [Vibrio europaeus]MDC5715382.1 glycosyltransferase family 2 protein [Vibrio europaeus]MDC5719543.1 glycosyltransferase family 2 protein [Vibrio europaeus]MDC5724569.1 glycosyltransferase family 2 protein [Vibrio europaeus]